MPVFSTVREGKRYGRKRRDPRVLQLLEVAVLRRTRAGEDAGRIAAALGMSRSNVYSARFKLRRAFGVETDDELVAHPDVVRQID